MDKTQLRLHEEFKLLPIEQQQALEVLALCFPSETRTRIWELIQLTKRHSAVLKRLDIATWRTVIRKCLLNGLVVERDSKLACNSKIADILLRSAGFAGRLKQWEETLRGVVDPWGSHGWGGGYYYESQELIAHARIAIHRNDDKTALSLISHWNSRFSNREQDWASWDFIWMAPFDRIWVASRAAGIREQALLYAASVSLSSLLPANQIVDLMDDLEKRGEALPWANQYIWQFLLMKGDLSAVTARMQGKDVLDCEEFRGCICSMRGADQEAIEHFEAYATGIRKETRRRNVFYHPFTALFYVLSLIRTGEMKRLVQAHKYIDMHVRKYSDCDKGGLGALKCAVDFVEGKTLSNTVLAKKLESSQDMSAGDQLFLYAVAYWLDRKRSKKLSYEVSSLLLKARKTGYDWFATECAYLMKHIGGAYETEISGLKDHRTMGVMSILDAIRDQQPWERQLAALEQMSTQVSTASDDNTSTSRLIWRYSGSSDKVDALAPFEQKLGASGKWSKGRAVALKRLHERRNISFLSDQDIRICAAITTPSYTYYGQPSHYLELDVALRGLVGHPHVYRSDSLGARVDVVRAEPELRVSTKGGNVKIELFPPLPEAESAIGCIEGPSRILVYSFEDRHRQISEVLGPTGLTVPKAHETRIAKAVSSVSGLVNVHSDIDATHADAEEVSADPKLHLHLTPYENGLQAEPFVRPFAGKGPTYTPGNGGEVVFSVLEGKRVRTRRSLREEKQCMGEVVSACMPLTPANWNGVAWMLPEPRACLELLSDLDAIKDRVTVEWPRGETLRVRHHATPDKLSLHVRKQRDWFGIDGELEIDEGLVLNLRELLEKIDDAEGRFVSLDGKDFIALTERFKQRLEDLAAYADPHGKGLRFHPTRAPALDALIGEAGTVKTDRHWTDRLQHFRDAQALDPSVPSTLRAELRDYQADGFRWATRLAAWGAGACLADDMGLGKTVQALATALARAPGGPALVVAPTSVCPNWMDEARRFAPTLNPISFGPGNRKRMVESLMAFDVLVCSYGLLHQESELLAGIEWQTIVLDEAQAIKNRETMRSRAAMGLQGEFKMITTGTPIENHLGELWNLFNFINPGLLGSSDSFSEKYAVPIHQQDSREAKARLKRLIQPFILRRTKTAVLDELPARTEITLRVEMTAVERAFYEAVRRRAVERLDDEGGNAGQQHLKILAEIMKLRRACCHPRLVEPEVGIPGSKLETFGETVAELIDNGHKALVFSQFVDHLSIVREHLDRQQIDYRYLDGSTPPKARKAQVDRFQAGEGDLFLISLRAGGQGLNLTAADYVIHLDPWWNPAVEDQASDRAHRIGQIRPVTIYRLVMKDTIEEKIVDLHAAKRDLADNLLEGADVSGKMSAHELLALIQTA